MTVGTGAVWIVRAVGVLITVPLVAMGTVSVVTWFVTTRTVAYEQVPGAVERLVLDTGVGDLTVRTEDRTGADVTIERRGAFSTPHSSKTFQDGVLTLKGWCDNGVVVGGNCSVDFVVVVPRGTVIDVRNGVGQIRVRGADAALTARSSVGDVDLTELTSPTVTATCDTGELTATFAGPPRAVRLDTSVGEAKVYVPLDGTRYRVDLKSDVGDERLQLPSDPAADRTISVTSSVGDVTAAARS